MTKNFIREVLLLVENSDLTHMATLAYSRQLQKGIPTAEVFGSIFLHMELRC